MFHSSQSRSDEPESQQERVTNTAAHNNRFYITDTDFLFFFINLQISLLIVVTTIKRIWSKDESKQIYKTITGKHVCQSYKIKEDLKNEMKEKSINTIKWGIFSRLSDNEKILWLQLNWSPTAASQLINMWQLWVSNMKVRSWSNMSRDEDRSSSRERWRADQHAPTCLRSRDAFTVMSFINDIQGSTLVSAQCV